MTPYGSQLDPIWIQIDPRWIHLDFIWIPSGSHMDPYNSQMDPFGSQIDPIWIHIMDPHGIHMGSIQKCRLKAKRPEAARLQTCAQQGPKQMCKNASGMSPTRCQAGFQPGAKSFRMALRFQRFDGNSRVFVQKPSRKLKKTEPQEAKQTPREMEA